LAGLPLEGAFAGFSVGWPAVELPVLFSSPPVFWAFVLVPDAAELPLLVPLPFLIDVELFCPFIFTVVSMPFTVSGIGAASSMGGVSICIVSTGVSSLLAPSPQEAKNSPDTRTNVLIFIVFIVSLI
jgi:hypothetical protein